MHTHFLCKLSLFFSIPRHEGGKLGQMNAEDLDPKGERHVCRLLAIHKAAVREAVLGETKICKDARSRISLMPFQFTDRRTRFLDWRGETCNNRFQTIRNHCQGCQVSLKQCKKSLVKIIYNKCLHSTTLSESVEGIDNLT
jgi:hypothetical protein